MDYDNLKSGDIVNGLEIVEPIFGRDTVVEYIVRCVYDNFEYKINKGNLKKGSRCPVCSGKKVVKGINDIATKCKDVIKFIKNIDDAYNYGVGSHKLISCECPVCGHNKRVRVYSLCSSKSMGCVCSDWYSYPNKVMYNILKYLCLDFEVEYSPEWISPKRYDFYIPSKNLIIEMDGDIGHGNQVFDYQSTSVEESLANDRYKDKCAIKAGIDIIRIDSRVSEIEYIKNNILKSELAYIFSLSNVNWEEIDKLSIPNILKIACDLWNSGNNNTSKIGDMLNVNKVTIIKYLKRGSYHGLCDYDAKQEIIKNSKRVGKNNKNKNCKAVLVYKDGECLGRFPSSYEIERISMDMFKTKITSGRVRDVCDRKRKTHKGMVFRYE